MKKSTIALGVAAALATSGVAVADSTLYGRVDIGINYIDVDPPGEETELGEFFDELSDGDWDIQNTDTFLGVRGDEDLGNGLSAIYRLEFGTDPTDTGAGLDFANDKWVGLTGGFGTFRIGSMGTSYDVGKAGGFNKIGAFEDIGPGREGKRVRYDSPTFYGFAISGDVVIDGPDGGSPDPDEDDIDVATVGAHYGMGPFSASVGYAQLRERFVGGDEEDVDGWGIGLGFSHSGISVAGTYEDGDLVTEGGERLSFKAGYSFGSTYIGARWGERDADDPSAEIESYALAVHHNLSSRTQAYFEIGEREVGEPEEETLQGVVGLRHDF